MNNKGADQPAHPRSLISAFVIRLLKSIISRLDTREISIFQLVSVVEQTGLHLALLETPKTGFVATRPECSFWSEPLLCLLFSCQSKTWWLVSVVIFVTFWVRPISCVFPDVLRRINNEMNFIILSRWHSSRKCKYSVLISWKRIKEQKWNFCLFVV